MGFGIISLLAYIAIILVMNMRFKRKIAESMGVALVVLLIISGRNALTNLQSGITFALKQEVLFVAMAFVFMSYLMNQTGIIGRLINILNSFLGRLRGGPGALPGIRHPDRQDTHRLRAQKSDRSQHRPDYDGQRGYIRHSDRSDA